MLGRRVVKKNERTRAQSTTYDNNVLRFGNNEIMIKNGINLELNVNTAIMGERYFTFTREELVGKEETSNPIAL